ncbi:MAG: beta-lactamase family protein [Alphaproteobacteria bacterium]|nr:beta-lactamase family protein [Alphaproteobacteria bacterium]
MAFRAFTFALLTFLLAACMAVNAFAQAIVLRPDDVLPRLKEASADAFYINGPMVHGLSDEMATTYYELGDTAKLVLALITLRLADRGVINLDESVAKALPDLLEFNPFEVAITPRHLLTETAGFAKPEPGLTARAETAPLQYFLIKIRGAGQIAVHDPIGWRLLGAYMEEQTGKPLSDVINDELLTPLGMASASLQYGRETPWQIPLSSAKATGALIARILEVLVHDSQSQRTGFLSQAAHDILADTPDWQMHPMGPTRFPAFQQIHSEYHAPLMLAGNTCLRGITLLALPKAGLVFADLSDIGCIAFVKTATALLDAQVPPTFQKAALREKAAILVPPTEIGHHFACADSPPGLYSRIAHTSACKLVVRQTGGDGLTLRGFNYDAIRNATVSNTAPYLYETPGDTPPLILSPYKAGGYAVWGGQTYVRTDLLGLIQERLHIYLPLMVIVLMSSMLHLKSTTSVQWRRFAVMGTLGTALTAFGLFADWHWWPTVLYEWQQPWLIALWRTGLNIGLMLVLSLPMFAMSFVRRQNMPKDGVALLFAGPHLGLISLAAIALFLTTVIWGVAGTFSAY